MESKEMKGLLPYKVFKEAKVHNNQSTPLQETTDTMGPHTTPREGAAKVEAAEVEKRVLEGEVLRGLLRPQTIKAGTTTPTMNLSQSIISSPTIITVDPNSSIMNSNTLLANMHTHKLTEVAISSMGLIGRRHFIKFMPLHLRASNKLHTKNLFNRFIREQEESRRR
jgi:hypothetical protein